VSKCGTESCGHLTYQFSGIVLVRLR